MFQFITDIVKGGWNAIDNVTKAASGAVASFTSPFFPTPQKVPTQSQITAPVESTGLTYRPTATEGQSMFETLAYNAQGWLGSPQEANLSPSAKRIQSNQFASQISGTSQQKTWAENIVDVLSWTQQQIGEAYKIKTVVDELIWDLGLKERPETVYGTPRIGYPEGQDETHLDIEKGGGVDVVSIIKGFGSQMLEQVKGLFNLGYESPTGAQPAFSIKHELEPSKATTIGIVIALVAIGVVYFLGRKR